MVVCAESGAKLTESLGTGAPGKERVALKDSVTSKTVSPMIVTGTSIVVVTESNVSSKFVMLV